MTTTLAHETLRGSRTFPSPDRFITQTIALIRKYTRGAIVNVMITRLVGLYKRVRFAVILNLLLILSGVGRDDYKSAFAHTKGCRKSDERAADVLMSSVFFRVFAVHRTFHLLRAVLPIGTKNILNMLDVKYK